MTTANPNAHREGKRHYTAYLTKEECQLVDRAKVMSGELTDRGLIVALCNKLLNT